MLEETKNLLGLEVYTPAGIFIGVVNNLVMDLKNNKIDGLFLEESNPAVADDGVSLNIPYRWVQSVGDIIILRAFPDHVTFTEKEGERSLPRKGDAEAGKRWRLS